MNAASAMQSRSVQERFAGELVAVIGENAMTPVQMTFERQVKNCSMYKILTDFYSKAHEKYDDGCFLW